MSCFNIYEVDKECYCKALNISVQFWLLQNDDQNVEEMDVLLNQMESDEVSPLSKYSIFYVIIQIRCVIY